MSLLINTEKGMKMDFLNKYGKQIFGAFIAVIVIGLAATLISQNATKNEKATQEKFFALDAKVKKYNEEKFKSTQPDLKKETVSVPVDVNQLKTELEAFINGNSGTVASQIAGLELAQLLSEDNKAADALALLQKVETKTDLLSNVLIRMKIAQYLADQDKCSDALAIWNKVLASKSANYIHAEAKINQALCYKKMNDVVKAEEILNQVKNDKNQDSVESSQEAERILRLIQFNKSFGT